MQGPHLLVEDRKGVATITINHPDQLNVLSHPLMRELGDVIEGLAGRDDVRAVVLTGAGDRAFAAGANIADIDHMTTLQIIKELPDMQMVVDGLERLPQPTIARVNGIALGGGTELALACDFRIASGNAVFGLPEVKLGMIPGYGGTQRLPRIVGIAKAKQMLFTGDQIDAFEALEIGLVHQVVDLDELDAAVARLAEKIMALPAVSLRFLKEAVNVGMQMDLHAAVRMEARLFAACFGTEDRREGVKAFVEKRTPNFKGC